MRIDVLTLFPEPVRAALNYSIVRRAQDAGLVEIVVVDIRDYAETPHRKADDRPFGGGPGMVMMCEPVFAAVEAATAACPTPARRLLTSPAGRRFDQAFAAELARQARLLIVCGHYEGVDERIAVGLNLEEVSIGDYVLTGGEPAAVVVVDATVRLLPGALGNPAGTQDESFSAGLLEYPQYTRPRSFRGMEVPPVLLSGDHAAIAEWRRRQSQERTRRRRGSAERPQGHGPTQEGGQSS